MERGQEPLRTSPAGALLAAVAACFLVWAPSARAEDALTGAAAWARVVGNTVSGTTPDGPYSELFAAGGALTIVDGDGKAGGRWEMKGDRLCTRVDDEDEECRALEVQGSAGTFSTGAFIDENGSRYAFSILPGNPKGL